MKINFIFVGKTKADWLIQGENEYLKRLKQLSQVNMKIVNEANKGEPEKIKQVESVNILKQIKSTEFVCLLTVRGQLLTSLDLSAKISQWEVLGGGQITFVVGGSWGVAKSVLDRANYQLGLSKMTFPHEMIRVFLIEQAYRAVSIYRDKEYHKGNDF